MHLLHFSYERTRRGIAACCVGHVMSATDFRPSPPSFFIVLTSTSAVVPQNHHHYRHSTEHAQDNMLIASPRTYVTDVNIALLFMPNKCCAAIFLYKGVYHLMNQAGGGIWTHAVSTDLAHWAHIPDALVANPNSTWDYQGPCDGTASFPAGAYGFDGACKVAAYSTCTSCKH